MGGATAASFSDPDTVGALGGAADYDWRDDDATAADETPAVTVSDEAREQVSHRLAFGRLGPAPSTRP